MARPEALHVAALFKSLRARGIEREPDAVDALVRELDSVEPSQPRMVEVGPGENDTSEFDVKAAQPFRPPQPPPPLTPAAARHAELLREMSE